MSQSPTLKRTFYFDGELLEKADFIRDQQYFRDVIAAMNKGLISPGVIDGLDLTPLTPNAKSYYMEKGVAVGSNGVPIVAAGRRTVPQPSKLADGPYNVFVSCGGQIGTDVSSLKSSHTIDEAPIFHFVDPNVVDRPENAVKLGQAEVRAKKIVGVTPDPEKATLKLSAEPIKDSMAPPVDAEPIADALATLRGLTGIAFTEPDGRRRLAVRADASGAKAVAEAELIGLLVEVVKTLSDRIEQLERQQPPPAPPAGG